MADSFQKRQKERKRQEKQLAKKTQRLAAKEGQVKPSPALDEEDPDIAGIRPGPQALDEQWQNNDDLDKG